MGIPGEVSGVRSALLCGGRGSACKGAMVGGANPSNAPAVPGEGSVAPEGCPGGRELVRKVPVVGPEGRAVGATGAPGGAPAGCPGGRGVVWKVPVVGPERPAAGAAGAPGVAPVGCPGGRGLVGKVPVV